MMTSCRYSDHQNTREGGEVQQQQCRDQPVCVVVVATLSHQQQPVFVSGLVLRSDGPLQYNLPVGGTSLDERVDNAEMSLSTLFVRVLLEVVPNSLRDMDVGKPNPEHNETSPASV